MDAYNKIFTIRFSRPREYFHCLPDNKLYELVRLPPFREELLATKSPCLHELSRTFEHGASAYAAILFDPLRCLDFILLNNAPLEETYISLIIRSVAELVVHLHSRNLFGISFSPTNFSLAPGGKVVLRNRFTLGCQPAKVADDWGGFCQFVSRIAPPLPPEDKASSMSRNFRLFLKTLEELQRGQERSVAERFAELLATKFLHQKLNILDDLVEGGGSWSEAELRKRVPVEVREVEDHEHLEASGNPFNLSGENAKTGGLSDEARKQELLLKAISTVFERHRGQEGVRGKQNLVNLLSAIETSLKGMEVVAPLSAVQLMRAQTRNQSS